MKTSIIYSQELWSDDEYFKLSLDAKLLYLFLISSPDRGYLNVFKWGKRFASAYTGLSESQVAVAVEALVDKNFVEVYENYICVKKSHVAKVGGPYGPANTERQLMALPEDVRLRFYPNNKVENIVATKPKKPGPPPETIKSIISKQHPKIQEALQEFVADRIERKRPPTTRAVKGWLNKLNSMYPNNHDKQAQSLYQSIERGWMGLFEVKGDDGGGEFL